MEITEFGVTEVSIRYHEIELVGKDQNGLEHTIRQPIVLSSIDAGYFPKEIIQAIAKCKEFLGLPQKGNGEEELNDEETPENT